MKIDELVINKKYKVPIYSGSIVVTYVGITDASKLHFICQKQISWYYPKVHYIPAEELSSLELELY
jgi:hypothetical protein